MSHLQKKLNKQYNKVKSLKGFAGFTARMTVKVAKGQDKIMDRKAKRWAK